MSDKRYSELDPASALTGAEILAILQNNVLVRTTLDALNKNDIVVFGVACSDEVTSIAAGVAKTTFRMPYGMTLTEVRASVASAQSSGSILTIDVNKNGTSILSTKLTIDNNEESSTTAAIAAVISDSSLPDDSKISIDVDQAGVGAKSLKILLIGRRT